MKIHQLTWVLSSFLKKKQIGNENLFGNEDLLFVSAFYCNVMLKKGLISDDVEKKVHVFLPFK